VDIFNALRDNAIVSAKIFVDKQSVMRLTPYMQTKQTPQAGERTQSKTVQLRAKAFAGEGVKINRFLVSGNDVRVLDKVAGHYTRCHSLNNRAISRIRYAASQL
jgi:hypothetical protein